MNQSLVWHKAEKLESTVFIGSISTGIHHRFIKRPGAQINQSLAIGVRRPWWRVYIEENEVSQSQSLMCETLKKGSF